MIAEGDEAFTEDMRIHFENAKRLYHQKLRPLIEKEHGLAGGGDPAASGQDDEGREPFAPTTG